MELLKNLFGFAFFGVAAGLATGQAVQNPSFLVWLAVLHNLLLAATYLVRTPAAAYDRTGLWLGLLAALVPSVHSLPALMPVYAEVVGLAGYSLVLWSLWTLGSSFGVAPADRGLVSQGPYRWVRHPMYLGELIFRFALITASPQPFWSFLLAIALAAIQVARILREERVIRGYRLYADWIRWRLVPGIW